MYWDVGGIRKKKINQMPKRTKRQCMACVGQRKTKDLEFHMGWRNVCSGVFRSHQVSGVADVGAN